MRVLIVGAGGMLGGKLADALAASGQLRGAPLTSLTLADLAAPPAPAGVSCPVHRLPLDIADRAAVAAAVGAGHDVIFHLAAIVSGHAEVDFDLGWAVNLQGSLNIFEAARALETSPVVVYTSSIAVFGGEILENRADQPIEDWTHLNPQTSYGAQKAAAELALTDYSRKGLIDGRGLRLPTISIRPGAPNRAASSFMSSIFREPLLGQTAICPVDRSYAHYYLSPRRCVANLIHAAEIDAAALGANRCFTLPGRTYTVGEMIDALGRVAGPAAVGRIQFAPDPEAEAILARWNGHFNAAKARALGFVADADFDENIRFFLEDDAPPERLASDLTVGP